MIDDYDDEDYDEEPEEDPLDPFLASGIILEVLHTVKSGKEGTVFCCRANPSTGAELLAAKVYRSRDHRAFKNDAMYREGRLARNTRIKRAVTKKTKFGLEASFGMWVDHEFQTLQAMHGMGANVPRPVLHTSNALLMEYVGDEERAAQPLQGMILAPDEARPLFEVVLANIRLWLGHNLIHGDLSAYNILYWNGALTIIDVPQAIDARFNSHARSLLERDITNVCRYFGGYGVRTDPPRIAHHLWSQFYYAEL